MGFARVLLAAGLALAAVAGHAFPTDEAVREILRQRIDVAKRGAGIVVGLVDERGTRVVAYGHARRGSDERVDGNSVFEIGSITKVFTALLLADMVEKGEVALHDPISRYVPATVTSPRAKDITLLHLTRHTAGLPSWPDNLPQYDPKAPWLHYSNEKLFAFLDSYRTRHPVGVRHSYSNYGVALLGELLARRAGSDFETVLRERVLAPLGMSRTGIALTPELRAAHALGHTARGRPLPLGGLRGAVASGALRSSVKDLSVFLQAELGLRETHLARAMQATQRTEADTQMPDLPMGLGWFHADVSGSRIVNHSGGTPGFRSYAGMDPVRKRGVVVLSNSDVDVNNLGLHLLVDDVPLHQPSPPREFTAVSVDPRLLDEHAGTYRRAGGDAISFKRDGDYLVARTRFDTTRVFAESPTTFFTEDMEHWGTFTRDAAGRVDGLIWYRENAQETLKRVN